MTIRSATVLVLVLAWAWGCAGDGDRSRRGGDRWGRTSEFSAENLVIHPLTRMTRERRGAANSGDEGASELLLTLHLELKDRYGHTVKALGTVRVELYRPGDSPDHEGEDPTGAWASGGPETQELVWDVDLSDPRTNAQLFDDLVTRTYVLNLGGLPSWVESWAAGQSRESWLTVYAVYITPDGQGGERRLRDSFRIVR